MQLKVTCLDAYEMANWLILYEEIHEILGAHFHKLA